MINKCFFSSFPLKSNLKLKQLLQLLADMERDYVTMCTAEFHKKKPAAHPVWFDFSFCRFEDLEVYLELLDL